MVKPMVLLETDHMTVWERERPEAEQLRLQLASVPLDDTAVPIASYETNSRYRYHRFAKRPEGNPLLEGKPPPGEPPGEPPCASLHPP